MLYGQYPSASWDCHADTTHAEGNLKQDIIMLAREFEQNLKFGQLLPLGMPLVPLASWCFHHPAAAKRFFLHCMQARKDIIEAKV